MDDVNALLKDVVFLSAVLMKGRYVTSARVSGRPGLEAFIRRSIPKGLYLLTTRSEGRSLRILVANGRVVGAVLELGSEKFEGDEAIDKGLEGEATLNTFEITEEVLNFVPTAKQVLEKVLSGEPLPAKTPSAEAKTEATPSPPPVETVKPAAPPTPPTPPPPAPRANTVASVVEARAPARPARAAGLKEVLALVESEVPRALDPLGVRVARTEARITEGETLEMYIKVVNVPPPEVTPEVISWVAMSKAFTIMGLSVDDYDAVIEVETPHHGSSRYHYITFVDKVSSFIHGVVAQVLFSHSVIPTPSRVRVDPDSKFVEVIYSVRPKRRDIALSSSMLSRLAMECVRIVKNVFPGRVRIRLKAGFLTEGRAEG